MDLSITQVPYWLSALFLISFFFAPVLLIARTAKLAYPSSPLGTKLYQRIVTFYWCYFAIVALVSLSGFYAVNVFPPRIIVFTVVPLFLFYLIYVQRAKWFKQLFDKLTLRDLIYIHIFRFVGVFFFLVYAYDALPKQLSLIHI